MRSQRLPLDKAKWFIVNRETGKYLDYGFPSKAQALTEVGFLNTKEYVVTPSGPRPPLKLKMLKGGKA